MVVFARPSHCAAFGRVGLCGDSVAVQLEVRNIVGGTVHLKTVGGLCRDHRTVQCPAHEVVARVGRGGQSAGREVGVGSSACHRAAFGRVGLCGDYVAVQLEIRNIACRTVHLKTVSLFGRHDRAVQCPIHEVVARVGRGGQSAGREVGVFARSCHRAALGRVGLCCDSVAVQLEVGHVVATFRYGDGECQFI